MKIIQLLFTLLLLSGMDSSCQAQKEEQKAQDVVQKATVEVYYFHYTRRCPTCLAVEEETKKAVAELYAGKVSFASFNLDEAEGQKKGEAVGVSGQTLLIVKGKDKIDLTNEGFLYAKTNPEELKKILSEKIDPLLK
jgi:hypothetical protein